MPSPAFAPPLLMEMRELWRAFPDPEMRRVLLEVEHLRGVLAEIETLRESIDRAWKADVGGQLVGLEILRCRLQEERVRVGIISGTTPP